ncbi:DHB8 dehydrogenase, partial [Mesembrinibis cayennensis]|nr:DHB8 dehydrogenase [Mesembrinibis cayennensis]
KGTFLVTQAVARALVATGAPGGSIIHVGSIVGKGGNLGQANYAAAKAGVEGLTRSCAKELARGHEGTRGSPGVTVSPPQTWRTFAPSWPRRRAATSRGPAWR